MKKLVYLLSVCSLFALMGLCSCAPQNTISAKPDSVTDSKAISDLLIKDKINYLDGAKFRIKNKDNNKLPDRTYTMFDPFNLKSKNYKTDNPPSREGMEKLNMSGSAQPTQSQFKLVLSKIKEHATGPIYIMDLRQESHALINGNDISWYGVNNWANLGLTEEQIMRDENTRLKSLIGQDIDVYSKEDGDKDYDTKNTIHVDSVVTEAEICKQENVNYMRFACTDHVFPSAQCVDKFINFVKTLPADAWMHFHCQQGSGRTAAFMAMYDMMKNPSLPIDTIVIRQCLYDRAYLFQDSDDGYKDTLARERNDLTRKFYQYVQENHTNNFAISWSEWLSHK